MNNRGARSFFLAAALLLVVYAAIFPLLTMDTLAKILGRASTLETRSLFLLLYLELSRLFTSLTAITIAIVLILRGSRRPDARALAIFLLFATITYEKVFGSNGYPGPVQERVTEALFAAGASPRLLTWLFGPLTWAAWPAAAALLRFSTVFPNHLEPEVLENSGRADRRGLMRSSGLAGKDIGAFFRGISKRLLSGGGFRPITLVGWAGLMIALHTALGGAPAAPVLWLVAFFAAGIPFTNLRAAYASARDADRVRLTWMVEGFVLALFMFLISAAILLVIPGAVARMAGFILIMLAPATIMVCMALSVLDHGELDAQDPIDRTIRTGTVALSVTVVFGVVYRILEIATNHFGMSHALASFGATIIAALGFEAIRRSTDEVRLRILERGGSK